jgi:hypothetical protein
MSRRWLCLVSLVLAVKVGSGQPRGSMLFEHIVPWLPSDMEVVYVSNAPVKGVSVQGIGGSVVDTYSRLTGAAMAEVVYPDQAPDPLAKLEASESLYTGRRFGSQDTPTGLGVKGRLEGCSFFRSRHESVDELLAFLDKRRDEFLLAPGVYRLTIGTRGPKTAVLSVPEPDLMMVCSDQILAGEILGRKSRGLPSVAFGDRQVMRKWVNSQALVWGFRQFTPSATDPTTPLSGAQTILPNYKDSKAIAMTFALESGSRARVVYITGDSNRASAYEQAWPGSSVSVTNQGQVGITLEFDPSQDPNDQMPARVMLMLLGILVVV